MNRVTVEAGANIAFIKYWGNRPNGNLPMNPSISMTLRSCVTTTVVELLANGNDEIVIGGVSAQGSACDRVIRFLEEARRRSGRGERLRINSGNSFPTGCGIASSASGFAALALAVSRIYGLPCDSGSLSRLARTGSGSAARSIDGGFVELHAGPSDAECFAEQLAPPEHWPELRDLIIILSHEEKAVSSADGHGLAHGSEMYAGRLAAVPARAERVRQAICDRDLAALGMASEEDALSMHAVMMTSHPPLLYWNSRTVEVIRAVWELRRRGVEAYFTIDAGPNVHVITTEQCAKDAAQSLGEFGEIRVDSAGAGARVIEEFS